MNTRTKKNSTLRVLFFLVWVADSNRSNAERPCAAGSGLDLTKIFTNFHLD